MRLFMHILLLITLAVSFSPCGHAEMHIGHQHDEAAGLCAVSCDPCGCHSCTDESCSAELELERERTEVASNIAVQPAADVARPWPSRSEQLKTTPPPLASGILAILKTIRLLI